MSCVLFSPVGFTDPIRFDRDGALLHIIRYYHPDKVLLYMSKEVLELENKDKRYTYCIKKLAELLNMNIEIEKVEKPNLTDVEKFDYFIDEFSEILKRFHDENPNSKMLINVSSGTPAMKSSLQILSLTVDYDALPIQVTTPEKKSNTDGGYKKETSPESQWANNKSNEKDENGNWTDKRCVVSTNHNLLEKMNKEHLIKLLEAYDYSAAANLADDMIRLDKKCKDLIQMGKSRLELKEGYINVLDSYNDVHNRHDYSEYLTNTKSGDNLSEYLLMLDILCRKEQYADLVRAITPAIASMFDRYLEYKCDFKVAYYAKNNNKDWDVERLKDCNTNAYNALNKGYKRGFEGGFIKSDHLCILISALATKKSEKSKAREIRTIEHNIRNIAAHNVVSVNADKIKKETGKKPNEIISLLFEFYGLCCGGMTEYYRNSYDNMNKLIIDSIRSPQQ